MNLKLGVLSEQSLDQAVDLLNQGFAGYYVSIRLDRASFLGMIADDSIDLSSSHVVLRDRAPVGIALIARRGWTSRLAGMAILPEARGQGIGAWVMDQLIAQARARGEREMVLEVIEHNEPGVRLYRRCGFQTVRRLVSYSTSQADKGRQAPIEEIDVREMARQVMAHGLRDLPWQISGESLALAGPPTRAYRLEASCVAITNPERPYVGFLSVLTNPEARRKGNASRLLRAVMADHPGKAWSVPALCPEEIGGLFEKVGLSPGTLSQLQMAVPL